MLKTKKILFSISALNLFLIPSLQISAAEKDDIDQENIVQINLNKNEEIKQEQFEKSLVKVLQNSEDKEITLENYMDEHSNVIQKKIQHIDTDESNLLDIETNNASYTIDENSKITFSNQGIILEDLEESKERTATLAEEDKLEENPETTLTSFLNNMKETIMGKSVYAAASKTKYVHKEKTLYSFFGTKVATASIGANFTYNGKKVTGSITHHYIKRNFDGFAYSIYDKASGINTSSSKKSSAFQEGIVSYGLAVNGVGLTFEETFLRVNVYCDNNGHTDTNSVVR